MVGFPADFAAGENSVAALLLQGPTMLDAAIEIKAWKSYSLTSNFLTPSDQWRAELGDELLTQDVLKHLIPGNRVQWRIDNAPQMAGYITAVDTSTSRHTGASILIEGFDAMWPVTDSQINPNTHYPDKISLDHILVDILPQFGFLADHIFIDNGDNINLSANRALRTIKIPGGGHGRPGRRHHVRTKTLKQYKLPKKKPEHNDTYWQFLMRLLNRSGLWMWPTVDGLGVVVSSPEYDQDSSFQLRRTFDGRDNNILHGGIRRDCQDQPSMIVARGNVPPTARTHKRNRVVIDNPYIVGLGQGATLQELAGRSPSQVAEDQARGQNAPGASAIMLGISKAEQDLRLGRRSTNTDASGAGSEAIAESQTYVSFLERMHTEVQKWTELIPVAPITEVNVFSPQTARPCFLRDENSHTQDELKEFAKRQMSLHTRRAFVAKYTVLGHTIGGVIPQPDMMCDVVDELSGFSGQLWVLSRTFNASRAGGVTTELELLAPNAVFL